MQRNSTNSNEIFEILLRDSLSEKLSNESKELGKATQKHDFKSRFLKGIKRIARRINAEKRRKIVFKVTFKSLLSVACTLGIIFCILLTQPTVYAAVKDVVRNTFSTHDSYYYIGEEQEESFDNSKKPGYIPDGYVLRFCYYGDTNISQTYEDFDGNQVYFDYGLADGSKMNVDNESHTLTEFNIDGVTFYFYETQNEYEFNVLLWYNKGYAYSISAQMSLEELVKIAENIK